MRILVAHNVPRARTGGMSRIMGLIHDEIAQAGHAVDYVTSEDLPARYHGPASYLAFPWQVVRRARAAARAGHPYDIVNVHEPSAAFAAVLRRAGYMPPVVVTSHGLERRAWKLALDERRNGRRALSWRARLLHPPAVLAQSRLGLALADAVFVLNDDDREALARESGRSPATILRIFPGATPAYADAARARDYARCRRVLFAGTWRANKGVDTLVAAMRQLWRSQPDLSLTIFGAGVPREVIDTAFGADAGRVETCAAGTDSEAARIYARADLFVLPSLFEGTPLVLMEAMASGLPIVTTRTCGMKDVIESGRNGLLVPAHAPAEIAAALHSLAADPALRGRLGTAAREDAASRYTWPQVAQPVLQAYRALLEGSRLSSRC